MLFAGAPAADVTDIVPLASMYALLYNIYYYIASYKLDFNTVA